MTASVEMTRLLDNVRMNIPGGLDKAIVLEMFNTLDDFFKGSRCWLQDISVPIIANTGTYTLTPAATTGYIIGLQNLVDTLKIGVGATMAVPGTLVLNTTPSANDTYTATVALTVVEPLDSDGYPNMPSWLLKKYADGIQDGIIGKMMTHAAKPYTNERMAIYHIRRFGKAIAVARSETRQTNVYDGQRFVFPQFARGKQR